MKISEHPRIAITQRDLSFDLGGLDINNWHSLGPSVSAYYNAMSIIFPEGEQFFIDSVRHFRDHATDPAQAADIRSFIGQEAMHGREHRAYNKALERAGYDVSAMERVVIDNARHARNTCSPLYQLALTAAYEHLTAVLAATILDDKGSRFMDGAPAMVSLWRWHSVEEAEHKAVAFDLYRTVAKPGLRSYLRRCKALFRAISEFQHMVRYNYRSICRHAGIPRSGWQEFKFNWLAPAMQRHMLLGILGYLRPGFHPWHSDNRDSIERWKAQAKPVDA